MEREELKMRAYHFRDADFTQCGTCAIARAAMDEFVTPDVMEGVHGMRVGKQLYTHSMYDRFKFDKDFKKAKEAGFDKTLIRTIQLIPI